MNLVVETRAFNQQVGTSRETDHSLLAISDYAHAWFFRNASNINSVQIGVL